MIRFNKNTFILSTIVIIIITLIIGLIIGCSITPGSIVKTVTKEITLPCEHVSLEDKGLIEQSIIYFENNKNYPLQRILLDTDTGIKYLCSWTYKPRNGYSSQRELIDYDVITINQNGDMSKLNNIVKEK